MKTKTKLRPYERFKLLKFWTRYLLKETGFLSNGNAQEYLLLADAVLSDTVATLPPYSWLVTLISQKDPDKKSAIWRHMETSS